ncbi:MAG: DotU family type IV/VI secretion system protein [Zoogloeaceae bacterium]|jgi:type VI protein secretion system component VasF|nr:DotU family type IV/VI secretion system protein [Zoogloeaceae bacterium]
MLKRFFPLMSEALRHARATGPQESLAELGRRIHARAEEERERYSSSIADNMDRGVDLDCCRLAVYAWVDEIMLTAPRPDAAGWVSQSLQYAYFQTSEAGRLFFSRLETLLEELSLPPDDMESPDDSLPSRLEAAARISRDRAARQELDVYALCLLLGFSGRCHGDVRLVEKLRQSARSVLRGSETPAVDSSLTGWRARRRMGEIAPALEWACYILLPLLGVLLFGLYCANLLVGISVKS